MRRKYTTDEDFEQAEYLIYNDIPTHVMYPVSEFMDEFREDVAREICIPGEEFIQIKLEDGRTFFAYTSYGRVINTKYIRTLKPSLTKKNILHYFQTVKLKSTDIFEQAGWDHNIDELVQRYKEKGWSVSTNAYDYTSW